MASLTSGLLLSARETVGFETLARRAISAIVIAGFSLSAKIPPPYACNDYNEAEINCKKIETDFISR